MGATTETHESSLALRTTFSVLRHEGRQHNEHDDNQHEDHGELKPDRTSRAACIINRLPWLGHWLEQSLCLSLKIVGNSELVATRGQIDTSSTTGVITHDRCRDAMALQHRCCHLRLWSRPE